MQWGRPGFDSSIAKIPWKKEKASSILAWRILSSIQSMGWQRVRHDWVTFTFHFHRRLGRPMVQFYGLSSFSFSSTQSFPLLPAYRPIKATKDSAPNLFSIISASGQAFPFLVVNFLNVCGSYLLHYFFLDHFTDW